MAAMGHQEAFLRPRLSARYRFSEGTLAERRGNGRDVTKAAISWPKWQGAPSASSRGRRRRRQTGNEFPQIRLPDSRVVVREMPVRVLAVGNQHVRAVRDRLEGSF